LLLAETARAWLPTQPPSRGSLTALTAAAAAILAAGLLEVPSLFGATAHLPVYLAGAAVAGVTAYLSVRFLDRYFEKNRLDPFAYYCLIAGLVALGLLSAGV